MQLTYRDKTFKERSKSFKPYRVKAIQLLRKYDEFEKDKVEDISGKIMSLFLSKDKMKKGLTQKDIEEKSKKFLDKVGEIITEDPDLVALMTKREQKLALAREEFLLTDNNARELCEIMLEDCDIAHEAEMEGEEYGAYMEFLKGLFEDFFTKHGPRTN